ncbi:MAG: hypothetical protein IH987_18470 [Planctomycetes bacterium]|nr:hypothetical protein [Planctomycetota bacterium]
MSHDAEVQTLDIEAEQRDAADETIVELAQLDPITYGLQRKDAAKKLGVTVTVIDQAVTQAKRDTQASDSRLLFAEIDSCSDHVDGSQLLADVITEIQRYIVLPAHAATAVTLWIIHTYAIEAAYIAPILSIESPQKRCGKSQLLTVINALVFRGLMVSNLSLAALYRAMDKFHPTLLIDEADSFLDDSPELRGIINAGHSRATEETKSRRSKSAPATGGKGLVDVSPCAAPHDRPHSRRARVGPKTGHRAATRNNRARTG